MEFKNKVAFTTEQIDYADFLVNWKKLDQKTCISYIGHKFKILGLDAYALYLIVKK